MSIRARHFARDPLAFAGIERGSSIQARGDLDANPWPATRMPRNEASVLLARFFCHEPDIDGDTAFANTLCARHGFAMRIVHRRHDARHAGCYDRFAARRRAADVIAWLERDVDRRASGIVAARGG